MRRLLLTLLGTALLASPARADEPFAFMTDWYAQAEQGGFYQALAEGTYKRHGLDVTIRMGGPQVNVIQLMAAGQAQLAFADSVGADEPHRPEHRHWRGPELGCVE